MVDRKKLGRSSRRRGHDWERRVATMLREAVPRQAEKIRRGQQGDGAAWPDVIAPGLWVECKRGAKAPIRPALRQAMDDLSAAEMDDLVPVAMVIGDGRSFPAMAVLKAEDFIELYRRAQLHDPIDDIFEKLRKEDQ